MSHLMAAAIDKMIDEEGERQAAMRRSLEQMRNAPSLGTCGKITWSRDELYDR